MNQLRKTCIDLLSQGRNQDLIERLIGQEETLGEAAAQFFRAVALQQSGGLESAIASYRSAVKGSHNDLLMSWNNLAGAYYNSGSFKEAVEVVDLLRAYKPFDIDLMSLHLLALLELGRNRDAEQLTRDFCSNLPRNVDASRWFIHALWRNGKYLEALLQSAETPPFAWDSGGLGYELLQSLVEMELCDVAEQLFPVVFNNTEIHERDELCAVAGASALARGAFLAAKKIYETGLAKGFQQHAMVINLSLVELILGDFKCGWEHYLIRGKERGFARLTLPSSIPYWQGESISGKTILISSEQGIGDMIQFVRFVPELERCGARIVFASYPDVVGLLRNDPRARKTEIKALEESEIDFHALLLDLPFRLGVESPDDIPRTIPYLFANSEKAEIWQSDLAKYVGLKVGVAWAGNPGFAGDHYRSASINILEPLSGVQGVTFFGLQKGIGAKEARCPPEGLPYFWLGDQFASFEDTAAAIANLDLVISTDTSIVHLAAALGKPVWLLLSRRSNDYRWIDHGNGNVWYPNVRVYCQDVDDDWVGLIRHLIRPDLARMAISLMPLSAQYWQRICSEVDAQAVPWGCVDWKAWAKNAVVSDASSEAGKWLARNLVERDTTVAINALLSACSETAEPTDQSSLMVLAARSLLKNGDKQEAVNVFQSVQSRWGNVAVGRVGARDWGWHHYAKSEWRLAYEIWLRAVEVFPEDGHLHYLLGVVLRSESKEKDALTCFRRALDCLPRHYMAMLGIAELLRVDEPAVAWEMAQKAALLKKNDVAVWQVIVGLFHDRGMYWLGELILLAKGDLENNVTSQILMGRQLAMLGRFEEGRHLLSSISLDSSATLASIQNYAHALYHCGMRDEAQVAFELVLSRFPESREARFALAFTQLRMGFYEEGWKNYRLSMRRDGILRFPEWKGEELTRKSLLVIQDQGQGDVVQFFPLLREIWARQPKRLVVAVSVALVTLFKSQGVQFEVVDMEAFDWDDYRFDFQVNQMALPSLLGVNLLCPSYAQPSLVVSPNRLPTQWREFVENDSNLKVGVVWSGGDSFKANYVRSTALSDWRELWEIDGISFYSLQKDIFSNQAAVIGLPLHNIAADCPTWLETLAAIDTLDLVITTCTAVAHAAASINKPTWIVLSNEYVDFRWLEDRDDSPWYPSVKLIRRCKGESWSAVFSRVALMLLDRYDQLKRKDGIKELPGVAG